jgi:hypothetical protein
MNVDHVNQIKRKSLLLVTVAMFVGRMELNEEVL